MSIFKDGEVRFPDVALIPIVVVTIVGLVFLSVMFRKIGYHRGIEYATQRIAKDCDRAYGSFKYRADDGSTYYFDCSFKNKLEKKPWDGVY